ncbi:protein phosphatase 2C domain-containing protein [Corynebacterium sp.]|uniref:PP2C family protein-serine/threonine phosphatase n=1 Tax=Corynebacterium sp. TaxID=1720 RepID=UPI0025BF6630|nr:protein phosphatase 2C domain-containing protein [Corynebacterium sp.]
MTETTARPLALNYAALSDRGLVRSNNEDSAVASPHLLALADGMGGHAAGEVASQLMITSLYVLENTLSQGVEPSGDRLLTMLAEAMDDGNRAIAAHVDDNPTQEGMGCTLTTMLFDGSSLGVCHVGDSRGYLLRDGELTQITKDDTFVQSLVDEGKLAPEDVSSHPQRSLILKALTGRPVEPTLTLREALPGDRYLLCSDGLSDPVSFDTIRDVLATGTPEEAGSQLINLALRGGGPDNVTVVVADVVDPDSLPEGAVLPTAPALAGAVNTDAPELPRPNTSAGRASAVNVVQRPRAVEPESETPAPAPEAEEPEPRKRRRKGLFIGLAAALVLILAAGAAVWYVRDSLSQSYFIAVADGGASPTTTVSTPPVTGTSATSGAPSSPAPTTTAATDAGSPIQIYQGAPGSILGISTQSVYQEVCLSDSADVRLLPAGSDDDCHRFSTSDLTPAARGTLDNLPTDSYDEIQGQIRRLAEQTLPVCVTRDDRAGSRGGEPSDLTTPGVSCREVN